MVADGGRFGIELVPGERWTRVVLRGEFDFIAVPAVWEALRPLARERRPTLLDMRAVTLLSAAALHLLLVANANASRDGWELVMAAPRGRAARVLTLTGVHAHLPLVDLDGEGA